MNRGSWVLHESERLHRLRKEGRRMEADLAAWVAAALPPVLVVVAAVLVLS